MSTFEDLLRRFQIQPAPRASENPFTLVSTASDPAEPHEVEAAWQGLAVPSEVRMLWSASRSARLFEDAEYGQWGLILLDPASSARRTHEEREARPSDFREGDIVIGTFLGDQELLVVAPSEDGARRILVALPIDERSEWFGTANDLQEFLNHYFRAGGNKFWESR